MLVLRGVSSIPRDPINWSEDEPLGWTQSPPKRSPYFSVPCNQSQKLIFDPGGGYFLGEQKFVFFGFWKTKLSQIKKIFLETYILRSPFYPKNIKNSISFSWIMTQAWNMWVANFLRDTKLTSPALFFPWSWTERSPRSDGPKKPKSQIHPPISPVVWGLNLYSNWAMKKPWLLSVHGCFQKWGYPKMDGL